MYEEVMRICVGSFCRFMEKAAEECVPDGRVSCRHLTSWKALLSGHETKCVQRAAIRFRVLWIWKEQFLPQ